jgi:cytochrome P450
MNLGGDTVSTAMTALFFYLSRYPQCYKVLQEEIHTTFTASHQIRGGKQLSSCRYLRACIDEALRMSPPISGTLWRERADADDKEPWVIDGHVIPTGTQVGVNTYAIHHDERYFPEPFTFRPERWLEGEAAGYNSAAVHGAFVPFSLGSRSCLGKSLAYLESSLMVAKTLWYFDFEKCPGRLGETGAGSLCAASGRRSADEFQLYDVLTSRHDGPYLVFKPRADHSKELEL